MVDFKKFKEKNLFELERYTIDKTLKSFTIQFEQNEKNLKEYSLKTSKLCEDMIQEENKIISKKIDDVKLENAKYHIEAIKKTKEMNQALENIQKYKNELKDLWEFEFQRIIGVKYDNFEFEVKRVDTELNVLNSLLKVI